MANGSNNARFLSKIDSKSKSMILENIAKHYGISTQEAFSEVTDSEAENLLDYMTEPARSAASVLMQKHGLRGFSRPGAKARFKVEDRFYFGKGRKERFAEPREIEAKIRAWIDSRGLPIGLQETNALSYIAAQHMLRGGVSIEQAVKSAARRHAQIGLASAGLRTWLGENA